MWFTVARIINIVRVCRKWHPDRNQDNKEKAEEKFREVYVELVQAVPHVISSYCAVMQDQDLTSVADFSCL